MKKVFVDEEPEEASEEELEEALWPEKGDNEEGSLDLDGCTDSDEEVPEVFTMIQGKSMAQHQRSEERSSERRIAAEVKKKRQERAAARKSKMPSEIMEVPPLGLTEAGRDDADTAERGSPLDDSVVQTLSKRERSEMDEKVEFDPTEEETRKKLSKPCTKRAKPLTRLTDDRTQIVNLSRDSSFAAERSAVEFKNGHLYGSRIRRDASMLRNPARIS